MFQFWEVAYLISFFFLYLEFLFDLSLLVQILFEGNGFMFACKGIDSKKMCVLIFR